MLNRARSLLTSSTSRASPTLFLVGWALLAVVYGLTATWGFEGQVTDSLGTALPAWNLAEHGSLELSGSLNQGAWIVETPSGYYSNRAPGLIGVTAVGYALASPFVDDFVVWPATLVAVIASSTAVAALALVAGRLSKTLVAPTFLLVGLGTAMWSVAADQIWPHGPAALAVALALWSIANDRLRWGGVAFAIGILIRPPVAVLAAVVGVGLSISRRSVRPLFDLGVPSAVAAVLFLLYGKILFGSWSPLALYSPIGGLGGPESSASWLTNVLLFFSSPKYGLLIWSSWILIGLIGLPRVWKTLPDWARWTPIAALAYLIVHARINRVSGGLPYNYRYALEAIFMIAPVLILALRGMSRSRVFLMAAVLAGSASVFLQGAVVFLSECAGIGTTQPTCSLFGF